MKFEIYFIALLILISACSLFNGKDSGQEPVARVYDNYLYKSDISAIIPLGISYQDSISLVKSYIDDWILQRLILHKAELNLSGISASPEARRIERQLQDYRNSLVNYAYKKELVRQKLDTVVTAQEIDEYHIRDMRNPVLKDNIKNIILNNRKLKLVEEMEENIYQDALVKNDFEIY